MFDLKNHTYNEVLDFLVSNYEKREIKPCCNESDALKGIDIPEKMLDDEYELFIVTFVMLTFVQERKTRLSSCLRVN